MLRAARAVLACVVMAMAGTAVATGLCQEWGTPRTIGTLDTALLPEASGIAASRLFENRLYHINDSGHGPYFYITNLEGEATRQVRVEGLSAVDPEDLALGPCSGAEHCLFIGDIGDNLARRDHIEIAVLHEQEFGDLAAPYRLVRARYPDGPRDAESLAVHPSGDLYILSKEGDLFRFESAPARLYRLSREKWEGRPNETHMLEFVGEIDLPLLNQWRTSLLGWRATAMDMTEDGKRLLVLTYENAIEFAIDVGAGLVPSERLALGEDYLPIDLRVLPQQEAIAYLPGELAFVYSTEVRPPFRDAELVRVDCLSPPKGAGARQ